MGRALSMVRTMSTSSSTTGTAITGTGVWHPEHVITNAELCDAFNAFVRLDNERNAAAIAAGTKEPLKESSPEFIVKASGIEQRYVQDKRGLLDPERMCPNIPDRAEDQLSVQAEYAVHAAKRALAAAGRAGEDVDLVILAASNLQRPYPAIAIEVQDAHRRPASACANTAAPPPSPPAPSPATPPSVSPPRP